MKKKRFKFIPMALTISLLLAGCSGGSVTDKVEKGVKKNFSASAMTVKDIKAKYGVEEETGIMPMYNVEADKEFTFTFNFKSNDILASDMVSVHTDSKALDESKIYALVSEDYDINNPNTDITIKPSTPVLASNGDKLSSKSTWGNAPVYYIRINYDLESDTPTKLDEPIIIPFTIKSEVKVPNLRHEIDADGNLKLVWDKVEGADSYNVYHVNSFGDLLKTDNVPTSGAETGYKGYPQLETNTTETEFDMFLSSMSHSGLLETDGNVTGQNQGVNGDYYVTAVKDGKESVFSKGVSTAPLSTQLPKELEDNIFFSTYDNLESLPKTVAVQFIDGSVENREVIYDTNYEVSEYSSTEINFSVKGTGLKGYVMVRDVESSDKNILNSEESDNNSGIIDATNTTDYVPDSSLPTIIETDSTDKKEDKKEDKKSDEKSEVKEDDIVAQQQENTKEHVEEANDEKVETPKVVQELGITANSAEEEYLALQLINAETDISLEAFPELQNFESLEDVFLEVTFQNPLVLGIKSYGYDYSTLTLHVEYQDDAKTIKKKQEEIVKEANKLVNSLIKDSMSDDEKRRVLYDYLNDNTKYDKGALENAQKNNFTEVDDSFGDSFSTYGIMVKKVGVCQSYATTYKMLLDLAGVENIVVTGYLDGGPHAWNKVKIDGEWLHVDSTNNETNSGVPYMLYQANDETAEDNNFKLDNEYWVDSEIGQFDGNTDKYDYYTINGLEVNNLSEYVSVLEKELKAGNSNIVIRFAEPNSYNEEELFNAMGISLQKLAPKKLETAEVYGLGQYITLVLN